MTTGGFMMNANLIMKQCIKALESNGFEIWIRDDRDTERQMYGIMYRKTVLLNIAFSTEVQLQTLLCLIKNYLASKDKETFVMKLTNRPIYPREYMLDSAKNDYSFQAFCLLNVG